MKLLQIINNKNLNGMKNLNANTRRTRGYFSRFLALIVVLSMNAFTQKTQGQTSYKVMAGSQIKVSGTSNLHDWSTLANSFACDGNFIVKGGQMQNVSSLNFILPVTNLKSEWSLMDTRTYKALNAEQFKTITFKLTQATVVPQQKIIKAIGNLTIGGVTNEIAIQTAYVLNADETITCKGTKSIKMSDFKIKAPSFMFGALKTGNEVIIDILLKLKK